VAICACPERDCVSREGPKWLRERLFNDREAELQPRVDRRRVRVVTFAPGARGESLAAYDGFVRDLARLDQPVAETEVEVDVVCDPVPLDEVEA
jgi:hypothetical protein